MSIRLHYYSVRTVAKDNTVLGDFSGYAPTLAAVFDDIAANLKLTEDRRGHSKIGYIYLSIDGTRDIQIPHEGYGVFDVR